MKKMKKKRAKRPAICPQCGARRYKRAILPDQVGNGLHEALYCSECGYEDVP